MNTFEIEIHKHPSKITAGFGITDYQFAEDFKPAVVYGQNPHVPGTPYLFQVREETSEDPELINIIYNALLLIFELKLTLEERELFKKEEGDSIVLKYSNEPIFSIRKLNS